ncbi:MAG: alpha/beta hydrolase [Lachnospiraceae bacterium]|nr:alpha/beta hydrolase [Lachnospiraceae bacterium]
MKTEVVTLNKERNVTLTAYLQGVGGEFRYVTKRPAILILPGGAYQFCSEREADPVAMPYLAAGYQVFILRYSLGENAAWPNPLNDYDEAMALIRNNAEEWNLYADKIAVIGFSAGGHLAGAAATMSKNRPNAAILGYAVLGEDVKGCLLSAPSTIEAVDYQTCPCFLFSSRTDNLVPIQNSIEFMGALAKYGISFESHIYSFGPHGFSTADSSIQPKETKMSARIPDWVEDSIGWLKEMFGDFGPAGLEVPACKARVNDDFEAQYTVDCTMECLMKNEAAAKLLNDWMTELEQSGNEMVKGVSGKAHLVLKMKLRDVLNFVRLPQMAEALNEKLAQIEKK